MGRRRLGANYGHTFKPPRPTPLKRWSCLARSNTRWLKKSISTQYRPISRWVLTSTDCLQSAFSRGVFRGSRCGESVEFTDLQQRNFCSTGPIPNHNFTRSLRLNFTIEQQHCQELFWRYPRRWATCGQSLWYLGLPGFWDPNRHFQSLNWLIVPFNYLPYLSFIDANFTIREILVGNVDLMFWPKWELRRTY